MLIVTWFIGLAFGYTSNVKEREKNLAISIVMDTQTQFDLGLKDIESVGVFSCINICTPGDILILV